MIATAAVADADGPAFPAGRAERQPLHASEQNVFRREGEYWTIRCHDGLIHLRDAVGLRYVARLLHSPHVALRAVDLAAAGQGAASVGSADRASVVAEVGPSCDSLGDAGPLLDSRTVAAYRHRLGELQQELEEAQRWSDLARADRLRAETDWLGHQLSAAVGLGGQPRLAAAHHERRESTSRAPSRLRSRGSRGKPRRRAVLRHDDQDREVLRIHPRSAFSVRLATLMPDGGNGAAGSRARRCAPSTGATARDDAGGRRRTLSQSTPRRSRTRATARPARRAWWPWPRRPGRRDTSCPKARARRWPPRAGQSR